MTDLQYRYLMVWVYPGKNLGHISTQKFSAPKFMVNANKCCNKYTARMSNLVSI